MRPRGRYINKSDELQDQISRCARKEKRVEAVLMGGILSFLIDSVDKRHVVHMKKGAPGIRSCSEEGYECDLCSFGHESRSPNPQLTVLRPRVVSWRKVLTMRLVILPRRTTNDSDAILDPSKQPQLVAFWWFEGMLGRSRRFYRRREGGGTNNKDMNWMDEGTHHPVLVRQIRIQKGRSS